MLTNKQTITLILFAQNYSLVVIAKKMRVSLTTIRQRIKALSNNHSKEFNNALGVRESYKRVRDGLRTPLRCGLGVHKDFDNDKEEFEHKF